ncbi:MAG TPA: carboxypeptidase-like regulatory domain-containing protein [Kofleriaceae bacterium]
MRKPVLLTVGIAVIAAFVWWFFLRSPSRPAGSQSAAKTEAKTTLAKPAPTQDRGPEREVLGFLVDDDPKGTLRLEGQVVDADDKPVAGATVVLSSNPPRTATSEADGGFAFDALVGRPYTLTARAAQGVAGPVTAKLTEKSDPIVLQLRPGAKVTVNVQSSDGKPIDGATVELRSTDAQRQTTKAGVATFSPVVPGGYQLAAWADGRARTLQWLQVGAGDTTAKITLVAGAPVSGRVVDEAGKPVAGARVTYHGASDWSQQADERLDGVETDKAGVFRFAAMPSGSFRFAAAHPNYARGISGLVMLDGKLEQREVTITVSAGAVVRGIVIDSTKQPIGGARVRIGALSRRGMVFEPPRQAYSDAKGAFELKGLSRRELSAVAIHETGASQNVDVDTTRGDVEGVKLVVDVTGTIAGIVVDPQGNPIEGAQVSAGPNFRTQGAADLSQFRLRGFPQELTDSAGRFTLVGLAKGSYMVFASRSQNAARGRMMANPDGGTLAETGKKDLKLVLQPEGGVKGKVQLADGGSPALFTVQVGFTQQTFSGSDTFELDALPPRKYELSVRGPAFQTRVVEVEVQPSKTTDAGTITVQKGRVLAGTVIADGQPVEGATVTAGRQIFGNGTSSSAPMGPMGANVKSDTTDASGKFSLTGFSAGDLSIVADHPNVGRSKTLRVPTGMPGQGELVLEIQKYGSIKGVMRVNGKPAEGVIVSCQSTTAPGAIYGVASGPDGVYRYDRLAPDTYKISATVGMPMIGMKFYSKEIVVPPGKEVSIDLAVEPGAITVNVNAVAKTGKLGVASAFLLSGVIIAKTANDLGVRGASSGPGSMQFVIIRSGESAKFSEVVPGIYSACVVPFPTEVQGMAAMGYIDRHGDALPAFCQRVNVGPQPETQTTTVQVEIPPFEPDDPGTGSGKPQKP